MAEPTSAGVKSSIPIDIIGASKPMVAFPQHQRGREGCIVESRKFAFDLEELEIA